MPPKYVQTVRQLIYWHYAHLIARAAGFEGNYGFIVSRYKKLDSGEMNIPRRKLRGIFQGKSITMGRRPQNPVAPFGR